MAGGPAFAHGSDPAGLALTDGTFSPGISDDRRGERLQIVPERQPVGASSAGALLPDRGRAGSRSSWARAGPGRARSCTCWVRSIARLRARSAVDGQELGQDVRAAKNTYRRDRVGFIFQSFNLISNLTALENVLVPFMPKGITPELRQRAIELLGQVGLEDRLDHRPYQLSGGEQQRVAIARALVKQPILLLADEPTGELDSKTGDEIYTILRRHAGIIGNDMRGRDPRPPFHHAG